jgi:histidinol-phosphate aminotransferase
MYEVYSKIFQTEYRRFGFLEDFKIDIEGLFEEINNSTTLVCLPNPNLPVESNVGLHEIREVATKCKEHDAVLVVDEAYDMFGVSSSIDLINEYDNLVILRSFSKAFGLAGIRLGYVLSNAENIEYLSKTRSLVEASGPSMAIAEYMLDHSEIAKDYVCRVREGAKHLQGKLDKLGLRWYGGAYSNGLLVFLQDVPAVDDLISKMKKQKIYIRGSFEPPYDCCIRITIGPVEAMDSFFSIFENCLKSDNGY